MFSKFSLKQKMLLANAVFSLVLCALLFLLVRAQNEPIIFGKKELMGNMYQKPAEKILHGLAQHKIYLMAARLDNPLKDKIAQAAAQIDEGLKEISLINEKIGVALQFTDEGLKKRKHEHITLANIQKEWDELKAKASTLKQEEINALHAHLIADIRATISHLGDTSNLVLDPDLDSYYLMDITLIALPQSQDRIQNITSEVSSLLEKRQLAPTDKVKLAVFAAMMKEADLERIKADYQSVLNEDANFGSSQETLHTVLGPAFEKFVAAYSQLADIVEKLSISETPSISHEQFGLIAADALKESFNIWNFGVVELDRLIESRVSVLESAKVRSIILSVFSLFAYFAFAWFFSTAISKKLQNVVNFLLPDVKQLRGTSSEISKSSSDLASAATQQASALQETAASIEQMNAMVKKSSENATRSQKVSQSSHDTATRGRGTVQEMIKAMEDINSSNNDIMSQISESNRQIGEIVKVITEIGNKTKVINEIVFQTKLLSFNASVEAARAGEHGKGFAVVAQEVGSLAQMSGNAAKEISDMLNQSIQKVEGIVTDTKIKVEQLISQGKSKVESGTTIAHECGNILEEVVRNVNEVNMMVSEISTATYEQSQGISEITKAMNQLDQVTHENASTSQQAATAAQQLLTQANSLTNTTQLLEKAVAGRVLDENSRIVSINHEKSKKNLSVASKSAKKEKSPLKVPDAKALTHVNVAKVISITKAKDVAKPQPKVDIQIAKKVASGDFLPSENDPRFKDI